MSVKTDLKIKEIVVHDEKNVKGFFYEYRFLSNFELCSVYYEGLMYPSSENAYQAAKTLDKEERKKFVDMTPGQSKAAGKILEIREDWSNVKVEVMYDIVKDKFNRNMRLKYQLLGTDEKHLEETNYWSDTYWGVCDGVGLNHLGEILMRVRKELKTK